MPPVREEATDVPRSRLLVLSSGLAALLALGGCSSPSDDAAADRPASSSPVAGSTTASSPPADATFPPPGSGGLATELESGMQKVLDDALITHATPGITAAVVTADGVWTGSAGRSADGKALDRSATFAIASITKTFTAAEVMLLAERGQVDLDAPLSSYVDLPVTDLGPTVLDTLGMRSGIPDFVTDRVLREQLRRPDRHVTTADMLALVPDEPSRPNVRNDYSNTNYLLLGQLIERVTGKRFADVVRQDLTGPLQLERSIVVQDPERPREPMARADVPGSSTFLPTRSLASAAWAAGGMAGDAESLARWGYLLYGGSVLEPETLRTMLPTSTGGYGLGTGSTRLTYHGLMVVGHGGDLPGYSTALGVQRENALSIAVLANDDNVRADLVMDALASVVLED